MTGKSARYENRNEKEERERNDNNKKVNNRKKKVSIITNDKNTIAKS